VRKKKATNPKRTVHIAIIVGICLVVITILVNYNLDQSKISGQRFGDQLAQIQTDLKNETLNFDMHLTQYKSGQISKDQMLKITDDHIPEIQKILTRYDQLKAPDLFGPSLQLFRLSTQTQIESDQNLREWIATGDNATKTKSDQLLQQAFQYEMSALQSYNSAKTTGSQ
jgi:high-affinity K+ transport system ATPase subunit B